MSGTCRAGDEKSASPVRKRAARVALAGMGSIDNDGAPRRLTLTVEEAGQVLGVSRGYAYELVRQGALPCMRLGRRIVIPVRALDALIDRVVAKAAG